MATHETIPGGDDRRAASAPLARRVYAGYFIAQAVVGVAFWVGVAMSPRVRSWFEMLPARHAVTDSFLFADVLLGIIGSLLVAWGIGATRRWAVPLAALTAGGLVYATLYLVAWVSFTGRGAPLLAIMVPPSTLSSWISYQVWRSKP